MKRTKTPVSVLLADDHTIFREGVAEIFAPVEHIRVVGVAMDGEEAVALAKEQEPDVVLLDVEMPGMQAEETIRSILSVSPSSKIIMLTMYDDSRLVRKFMKLGARAYMIKSATREELVAAVNAVHNDDDRVVLSVSRETLERLEKQENKVLSARELEIVALASRGMSNGQIASRLFISEGTVKRHLTNVFAKLGVVSRVDAINRAVASGLITGGEFSEPTP